MKKQTHDYLIKNLWIYRLKKILLSKLQMKQFPELTPIQKILLPQKLHSKLSKELQKTNLTTTIYGRVFSRYYHHNSFYTFNKKHQCYFNIFGGNS